MNCDDFHETLDQKPDAERQASLFAHAAVCPQCQAHLQFESLLQRQLRTLPIPAPRPGFEQRVLARAHRLHAQTQKRSSPRVLRPILAMAASMLLMLGLWWASGLTLQSGMQTQPTAVVAQVPASRLQSVRLMFRSDKPLPGVTIELQLPEGVEIAGYPNQQRLSWQADLQSGPNMLELPVLVSGDGGVLMASLNLGTERRQFSVRVQASSAEGVPHA